MRNALGYSLVVAAIGVASILPENSRAENRFAITVGNDVGAGDDTRLRWAERDAARFDALLGEIGGVPDDRRVLLLGEGPEALGLGFARVRGWVEEARRRGERTVLFVYYSGHGDKEALRMRGARLAMTSLRALLRSVPAAAAVLIVDACHSGALVSGREKGMQKTPRFEVSLARESAPEGLCAADLGRR